MLDFSKFKNRRLRGAGIGEVLFDVYPTGPKLGGAPANFAFHCKELGVDALMISSVGRDELGFAARDLLAAEFLPALLPDNDHPTATVQVSMSSGGIPDYTFAADTAFDHLPLTDLMLQTAKRLDMVCFGSLAQRSAPSHQTIQALLAALPAGALRVFDVNLRGNYYCKHIIETSLASTDILKCNENELPVLCEYAGLTEKTPATYYAYLKGRGISGFIFTEGAHQSTIFLNDECSVLPTPKIRSVDTVGAGDAFTAAAVSMLMRGFTLQDSHHLAVETAAYVCTQQGGMPQLPAELVLKSLPPLPEQER